MRHIQCLIHRQNNENGHPSDWLIFDLYCIMVISKGFYTNFGILPAFRSGYRAFLNRKVSPPRQRKATIKKQIQHIYDDSNQSYVAPKITKKLLKSGECISQHTVGKYMREIRIKT